MTRQLNLIAERAQGWWIERAHKMLAGSPTPDQAWEANFNLAVYRYNHEALADEVRGYFVAAERAGFARFENRPPPTHQVRTPWSFGLFLGTVAAFGTAEERRRAGAIERWKWFAPEQEPYITHADALSHLQAYLRGELDLGAARDFITRFAGYEPDRNYLHFDRPLVAAVIAIHGRDQAAFSTALGLMVDEHRFRAREGILKLDADGIIAVLPLGMVRLAREAGLECTVESPYLPVELLGATSRS